MEFSSRKLADVIVAAPTGHLDHANAQALQQALAPVLEAAAGDAAPVVLDFAGVDYISSMGLRVLMMASKQMRTANARFVLAALQPIVDEIFDIARFKLVVQVFPSVRAALQDLSPAAAAAYDAAHA